MPAIKQHKGELTPLSLPIFLLFISYLYLVIQSMSSLAMALVAIVETHLYCAHMCAHMSKPEDVEALFDGGAHSTKSASRADIF